VTLGGDHSITIPVVRAVRDQHANPGLVLIGHAPRHGGRCGRRGAQPLLPDHPRVDAGFDPGHIALVAVSGWMNPRTEIAYCRERGITVIWLEEIWERGTRWAAERALEVAAGGTDGVYLSFDVDSLDAAFAAATCCPTPGGLTSREAIELVRMLAGGRLLGVDVVEAAPSLEATPATSLMAGRIAVEAMAHHGGAGR
jgi:arginase family enzyme